MSSSSHNSLNKSNERKKSISGEKRKPQKKPGEDEKKSNSSRGEEEKKSTSSSRRKSSGAAAKTMSRTLQLPDGGSDPLSFEGRMDPDEPLTATKHVSWLLERPVVLHTAKTGPLAQKPMTVMSVLRDSVNKYPNKLAFASMVDGKWVKVTYQKLLEQVQHAAQSFIKLGLQRFNGVGILGHNATEYVVTHFGIIFAGGVSVPLHTNTSDEFSLSLLKATRCRILVVDSVKLRPQVLAWQKTLPNLKTIVQFGQEKTDGAVDPFATDIQVGKVKTDKAEERRVYKWEEFMKLGNDVAPDVLMTRTLQQAPNLCCCILQTAGCSGFPKNVMLSHDNLNWGANTSARYLSLSDGKGVMVSFLPLSMIYGLNVSVNVAVRFGVSVYLITTVSKALIASVLKEIRPTIFFGPYIFYESLRRGLEAQFRRKSIFKRIIIRWAMRVGRSGFDDHMRLKHPPRFWMMANRVLFRKVREQIGLDACIETISAGGFMIKSDIEFFLSIDMPILLGYGLTEASGSHAFSTSSTDRFRIESVGIGMDGCEAKIVNPDANGVGELCIGGRNVAMGYLDSEELTNRFFAADGTFRTGDLARKDAEGFLYIVGRIADVVTLSGGEKVSTIPIVMSVLSNLPFVSRAIVVGEGREYLSMLMTIKTDIDPKTETPSDQLTEGASLWFRKAGFNVKLVRDIVPKSNPKLLEKIQTIIDRINAESPHVAHQIKKWTILSNDFTTQSDELSPTMKVRRWIIVQKYAVTIDSMYS